MIWIKYNSFVDRIELKKVPSKIVLEAFLSGPSGGPGSYGGLDGKGPLVLIDLEKQAMVPVPGFQRRLRIWKKEGGLNPCPLSKRPQLQVLNAFLNHEDTYYSARRRLIVSCSGAAR